MGLVPLPPAKLPPSGTVLNGDKVAPEGARKPPLLKTVLNPPVAKLLILGSADDRALPTPKAADRKLGKVVFQFTINFTLSKTREIEHMYFEELLQLDRSDHAGCFLQRQRLLLRT